MEDDREKTFNIRVIGDTRVGKSRLIYRFTDHVYGDPPICGIGVDFSSKHVEIDGSRIRLLNWDTLSMDLRYWSYLCHRLYRGKLGVMVVFDLTNMETFENAKGWLRTVGEFGMDHVSKVLIGCKCDLIDERVVPYEMAKEFADRLAIRYIETSAKANINVDEAFLGLAEDIKHKIDIGLFPYSQTIRLEVKNKHIMDNNVTTPHRSWGVGNMCSC